MSKNKSKKKINSSQTKKTRIEKKDYYFGRLTKAPLLQSGVYGAHQDSDTGHSIGGHIHHDSS